MASKKKSKKHDHFEKLFSKILEKIIDKSKIAVPMILKSLFGIGDDDLKYYYTTDYSSGYDYGYGVQTDYKKYGLTGYLPVIVMKLLSNLSYFVGQLQKNKFIKNFFVPGMVTAGSAGLVVFLVWWLTYDSQYEGNYPAVGYYGGGNYRSADTGRNTYDDRYRMKDSLDSNINKVDKSYSGNGGQYGRYSYND